VCELVVGKQDATLEWLVGPVARHPKVPVSISTVSRRPIEYGLMRKKIVSAHPKADRPEVQGERDRFRQRILGRATRLLSSTKQRSIFRYSGLCACPHGRSRRGRRPEETGATTSRLRRGCPRWLPNAHKTARVWELVEAKRAYHVFLAAYSPDFNPIETGGRSFRRFSERPARAPYADKLSRALRWALLEITSNDAHRWFSHCGLRVPRH
jgi:hypothetical protein